MRILGRVLAAVAAVSVVTIGVSVWVLARPLGNGQQTDRSSQNEAQPTPEQMRARGERSAPLAFTGAELEWLLLDDELAVLVPAAVHDEPVRAVYDEQPDGVVGDPVVCLPLIVDDSVAVVGYRQKRWGGGEGSSGGAQHVMQFASAELAARVFADVEEATRSCEEYNAHALVGDEPDPDERDSSFTVDAREERDGTTVIAGADVGDDEDGPDLRVVYAQTANVLYILRADSSDVEAEPQRLAAVVADQIESARGRLAEAVG